MDARDVLRCVLEDTMDEPFRHVDAQVGCHLLYLLWAQASYVVDARALVLEEDGLELDVVVVVASAFDVFEARLEPPGDGREVERALVYAGGDVWMLTGFSTSLIYVARAGVSRPFAWPIVIQEGRGECRRDLVRYDAWNSLSLKNIRMTLSKGEGNLRAE